MKDFARLASSVAFCLALLGASFTLTGCSADTLSGPNIEAYGTENGDAAAGSGHNNGLTGGDTGDAAAGSGHNNGKGGDGDAAAGSGHNNG